MENEETNQAADDSEIRVEKLVYGGDALARLDGRIILTPFLLPGEIARVETSPYRSGLLTGKVAKRLSDHPERAEPRCPYFGRCGGCQYQHARYPYQLDQKREILREVIRRIGHFEAPDDIEIISGYEWEYRNRSQFHFIGGELGYLEARSHRLCPVYSCPISSPRVNEVLAALQEMRQDRRFPRFVQSLEVFTNETDAQLNVRAERPVAKRFFEWAAERIPGLVKSSLDYPVGRYVYRVGHKSFFQVNRFLIEDLVRVVLPDTGGELALDLYAGVGLFTLPLTERFGSVLAVESGAGAVRDLLFNADRAGVPVQAAQSDVGQFLAAYDRRPDFVVADPPRGGLGKQVVSELLRLKPPRLTIVSCDPSTLARDLAPLLQGGYSLQKLTLVDLFPQTFHIESVAQLAL